MVISTLLPHIEATIAIDDDALTEHEDPSLAEPERTTTRYIESTTDATFSVDLKVGKDLEFIGNALLVQVSVDGKLVQSEFIGLQEFQFADLRTVAGNTPTEGGSTSLLGTIHVQVDHCMVGEKVDFEAPESNAVERTIEETELEGQSLSNFVTLKEPVKRAPTKSYTPILILDQPSPFATYAFKYRSHEDLRNLHILPRTPPPEPTERRDPNELSAADIAKLQQKVTAVQAEKVKLKREMAETNERARKKARMTQLELAALSEVVVIDD
ncbi:hypothetical protein KC330_g7913 [Hortaea werneckii]|nr:hypothetical protein KC330_g7913 [Hortaea werneckii]